MLIQFNFQNYKSFRDSTSLDLRTAKITEHSNRTVNIGNDKLLRIAAIYGANAGGKSNVYKAFQFMSVYVLSSFEFGGSIASSKSMLRNYITTTPFMFDKASRDEKSVFEVFFIIPSSTTKTYQYGFALKGNKVLEEWLYSKAKTSREYKTVFYRNTERGTLDLNKNLVKGAKNIRAALEEETLVVSLGAKLKINILKMIYNWFMDNEITDSSVDLENLFRLNVPDGFINDTNLQNEVVKFFQSFDNSIIGFDIEKLDDKGSKRISRINTKHRVIGCDETASIPLWEESEGTLKMLTLFSYIRNVLKRGSVLFIDEINTKLHPLLVRNIILTFANPETNTNNAQLIFTTHDSWHLSNNLLRRDEIWFTEKSDEGVSTLYSLADFSNEDGAKIRKDESYEKNYLLGKYGAIPTLKTIDFLIKE
jgi:AAA15 family ATPase/GTPase